MLSDEIITERYDAKMENFDKVFSTDLSQYPGIGQVYEQPFIDEAWREDYQRWYNEIALAREQAFVYGRSDAIYNVPQRFEYAHVRNEKDSQIWKMESMIDIAVESARDFRPGDVVSIGDFHDVVQNMSRMQR